MNNKSDTYYTLIELLLQLSQIAGTSSSYSHTFNNNRYERVDSGISSTRLFQPILIADTSLIDICDDIEWKLIRTIMRELKEYNCLWYCNPILKRNSNNKIAIKQMITKGILSRTETTNIYIVNARYLRRGDLWATLATTAKWLSDEPRVGIEHIVNRKPVKEFDINTNYLSLNTNSPLH